MLTLGAQVTIYVIFNPMSNNNNITWSGVDWTKTQHNVRKLQHRIYKARLKGNLGLVHRLQKFLINSMSAKLVSVYQVTCLNQGRLTTGIDKQIITTAEQRWQLAINLSLDGHAIRISRAWVDQPEKIDKRPLSILVLNDRAKQSLAKLALEPEWEAVFEANSYGFRPGLCAHDAIEAIYESLHQNKLKYVYHANVGKCFDTINQVALLEKLSTFPLMKRQIASWLKAGAMKAYAHSPKDDIQLTFQGTPNDDVISPLLANIALHGLENHMKDYVTNLFFKPYLKAIPKNKVCKLTKTKALSVIRYGDDFVLIHTNTEILEQCVNEAKKWLSQVGLIISEEKNNILNCCNGFLFIGFQIIQTRKVIANRYKVKIQPSRKSQGKLLLKIRTIIQKNKSVSSYHLITMLRPVIIGWGNYFKYCESKEIFSKLSNIIFQKLRAWVFRRDNKNGRIFLKGKYFPSGKFYHFNGRIHQNNWILTGKQKSPNGAIKQIYLPPLTWVRRIKHIKVRGAESPFSRSNY